jgi:NADPH:quinone reductase-like Zn-dependent oxidoreductase
VPNIPRKLHRRMLVRGGHYVTTIPGPATFLVDPFVSLFGGVRRHGVMLKPDAAPVDEVLGYATGGRLRCAIEQEFALQDALAAIERSRTGRVLGKVVVAVA